MDGARTAALRLRSGYWFGRGGSPALTDLLQVAADLGVAVDVDWPLPGRVRSIYGYGAIALQAGLPRMWQRWCLAHEIGHHLLHHPRNHLYLARRDRVGHARQEAQAETFAGFLLFGALERLPADAVDVMELALAADLPYPATDRWVTLAGHLPLSMVSLDRRDIDYDALRAEPLAGEHRVRPWSPFLAAVFAGVTALHADIDGDGVVQVLHWMARTLPHLG